MSKKINIHERINFGLNFLVILLLKSMSHLPFCILYGFSDLLALILQYIVRYRKSVVVKNIHLSFPEKSDKEVRTIVKRFYRHFSDIIVETIKAYSMSWNAFTKRITFLGIDKMDEYFHNGRSILLFGMHYNNWEWSGSAQPLMKHQYLAIVNPMRNNPLFERYMMTIRERWGSQTIPVNKSGRTALELHKMKKPVALGLGADQRPASITQFWTIFLNQETCFNPGPMKIAHATNLPIFFHITRKIKRGYYEVTLTPMIDNPAEMTAQEILRTYVLTMEHYIREAPQFYLWSHRRWKQKRPADQNLF